MAVGDDGLFGKLSKLEALFARAGTPGERNAAGAAIERLKKKVTGSEPPIELAFSLGDVWSVRLFVAVCRKHQVKPYRYPRQRRTTVMARAPKAMLEDVIWAEFSELQEELNGYFTETVDHLIKTAMGSDGDDSDMQAPAALPGE